MAFFPLSIMPKRLQRETAREVDDSPSIYNARDYNIHHRELLAIERFLIGDDIEEENGGLLRTVSDVLEAITKISNEGLIARHSGIIQDSEQVIVPESVVSTLTNGVVGAADVSITVVSTDGFPSSGVITKFNNVLPNEQTNEFDTQKYEFGPNITNQEFIEYSGKTTNMFTGCTRGIDGTTAQAVLATAQAVIMAGRASLFLSNTFWTSKGARPVQLITKQEADLTVAVQMTGMLTVGSPQGISQVEADFTVTDAGRGIGLLPSDVIGDVSHSILFETPNFDAFDVDGDQRIISSGVRGRMLSTAGVGSVLPGAGGLFITGHDPDYHVLVAHSGGALNIIRRAVEYVTFGLSSPTMLLVTDIENPGGDQSDSRLGMIEAGYSFDVADYGSGSPGILDVALVDFNDYDVVVVASIYGGWLRQREIDVLEARTLDMLDYVNSGGGIVAFNEGGQRAGEPPPTPYSFLPFVVSGNIRYAESVNSVYALTTVASFEDIRIP
jgi:hypothetical protein